MIANTLATECRSNRPRTLITLTPGVALGIAAGVLGIAADALAAGPVTYDPDNYMWGLGNITAKASPSTHPNLLPPIPPEQDCTGDIEFAIFQPWGFKLTTSGAIGRWRVTPGPQAAADCIGANPGQYASAEASGTASVTVVATPTKIDLDAEADCNLILAAHDDGPDCSENPQIDESTESAAAEIGFPAASPGLFVVPFTLQDAATVSGDASFDVFTFCTSPYAFPVGTGNLKVSIKHADGTPSGCPDQTINSITQSVTWSCNLDPGDYVATFTISWEAAASVGANCELIEDSAGCSVEMEAHALLTFTDVP
jgi:hypothetical protein